MRWVPDRTGRFPQRPYYSQEELDRICEARVRRFLQERAGRIAYPLSTNDLIILIDQDTDDLDLYADLSDLGRDHTHVEGVTDFFMQGRPRVRIARGLAEDPARELRLRTTLAHEYGHVLLHDFAGRQAPVGQLALFDQGPVQPCVSTALLGTGRVDWMEWQAGYASGALLMPRSLVQRIVGRLSAARGGLVALQSKEGQALIRGVRDACLVSPAAARVRLLQLGCLTDRQGSGTRGHAVGHDAAPCQDDTDVLICQLPM